MARLMSVVVALVALSSAVLAAPVVPASAGVSSVHISSGNKHQNFLRGANLPTASRLKKQFDGLTSAAKTVATSKLSTTSITESEADDVFIHPTGEIYIADSYKAPVKAAEDEATQKHRRDMISNTVFSSLTSDGIPIFHSKPGSPNTIYIDFNGHVNPANNGWGAFTASGFDPSGNGIAFDATEKASMVDIWRRVAEDYSPFDVDVTTEEPATFTARTGRILVTKHVQTNGAAMPAPSGGGISFVGVFGQSNFGYYSPAIVYWDNLYGESDYVAEACTHEMGHNLGLSHDGDSTQGYYPGGGAGTQSWAPIMGAAYAQAVTVFNPGNYPGANNKEDDIAIISKILGFRADTVGNSPATATTLSVDATGAFSVSGVINTAADVDYYKVVVGTAGKATFAARVFADTVLTRGANLDTRMELYDSTGTNMITFSDDLTTQDSSITTTLAAGTYYVSIQGVGGALYTDYGSMGQYNFVGSIPPTSADKVAAATTKAAAVTTKASSGSKCTCPASGPKWQSKGTAQVKVPFRTTCSKGFTFNVCLQDVAAQATYTNYRLELYNGNYQVAANLRASADSSSTANECITYTTPASDSVSGNAYYIVVRSLATGSTMSSWSLKSNVASVSTC